jgi:hypothetical protein
MYVSRASRLSRFATARARKAVNCSCRRSVSCTRRSMSSSATRASCCSCCSLASAFQSRRSLSTSPMPRAAPDDSNVEEAAAPRRRQMLAGRWRMLARRTAQRQLISGQRHCCSSVYMYVSTFTT